ncbi:MAG: hypothetical protein FRX49_12791 [Trebouxia sp. A1-2]|nr:MAG: hypothetical protein FRX49_12791 [Trebouxia sp. A1-2]
MARQGSIIGGGAALTAAARQHSGRLNPIPSTHTGVVEPKAYLFSHGLCDEVDIRNSEVEGDVSVHKVSVFQRTSIRIIHGLSQIQVAFHEVYQLAAGSLCAAPTNAAYPFKEVQVSGVLSGNGQLCTTGTHRLQAAKDMSRKTVIQPGWESSYMRPGTGTAASRHI